MGNTAANNSWMKIQQGINETERMIGQKQYNMAMIKARQTLEFMVNILGEKALIVDGDLVDSIDQLYEGRWITKQSYERYHRIRILGNKAVHEGDNSASDANQAYQLLSQEGYTFVNEYMARRRRPAPAPASGSASGSARSSRPAGTHSQRPPQRSQQTSRGRKRTKKQGFDPYDLVKPLVILVIIVLIALLIKFLLPDKDDKPDETTATVATTAVVEPETTTAEVPTTEPQPVETTAAPVYKTTSNLNVREKASKDASILGTIPKGSPVDYVGDYDETWSVIRFNDKEAYVSNQFLTKE